MSTARIYKHTDRYLEDIFNPVIDAVNRYIAAYNGIMNVNHDRLADIQGLANIIYNNSHHIELRIDYRLPGARFSHFHNIFSFINYAERIFSKLKINANNIKSRWVESRLKSLVLDGIKNGEQNLNALRQELKNPLYKAAALEVHDENVRNSIFYKLPTEMILLILSYIAPTDLLQMRLVSSFFSQITQNRGLKLRAFEKYNAYVKEGESHFKFATRFFKTVELTTLLRETYRKVNDNPNYKQSVAAIESDFCDGLASTPKLLENQIEQLEERRKKVVSEIQTFYYLPHFP